MLHDGLQVDKSVHTITRAIIMLNNTFPLHPETQNYHLKYPNLLR